MISFPGVLRRSGGRALAIACVVAAVSISGVAAKNQNSFDGTVNETFTATACPTPPPSSDPYVCALSTGSSNIGDLGIMSSSLLGIVDFNPTRGRRGCLAVYAETSSGTLTAKNGDQINVKDSGTFVCITGAGSTATVKGNFAIDGGTGSFSGATGGGTFTAKMKFDPATFIGSSTEVYTGRISLPHCDSNNGHSNNASNGNGNGNGHGNGGCGNGGGNGGNGNGGGS